MNVRPNTTNVFLAAGILLTITGNAAAYNTWAEARGAAWKKYHSRDYPGAMAAADEALKMAKTPDERADANYVRGQIAARAGKPDEARKSFDAVLAEAGAQVGRKVSAVFGLADLCNSRKAYEDARSWLDKGLAFPGLTARQRFDLMSRKASTYEREGAYAAAREEYEAITTAEGVDRYWRVRAGSSRARAFSRDRLYDEAIHAYRDLFQLDGLTLTERKNLHAALASVYWQRKDWPGARREHDAVFKLEGLGDTDRIRAYCDLVETELSAGDFAAAVKVIEACLTIPGAPERGEVVRALGRIGWHAHPRRKNSPAHSRYVCEKMLALPAAKGTTKAGAYFGLLAMLARDGNRKEASELLEKAAADSAIAEKDRFKAAVIAAGFAAPQDASALGEAELKKIAARFGAEKITPEARLEAVTEAGKVFVILEEYATARKYAALNESLFKKAPAKTCRCRYVDKAPLGAGGWFLSDIFKDQSYRERGRFVDYNQKAADMLVTDIAAERVTKSSDKKAIYFDNAAFYMVYDRAGWHIFVHCGEPDAEEILADGRKAGALEMYFCPGFERETYFQWIISHPGGDLSVYDWNSPHRYFRKLKDSLKSETVMHDKSWGSYIFIPWEALYDKLPLEGGRWPFGFIRWSPGGGISWGEGGRVHQIGKWGLVEWQEPSAQEARTIRTNVLRKAWSKYKARRGEQKLHWQDRELGDPAFYESALAPAIERLDQYGEQMNDPAKLNDEGIRELYDKAISDWMEFDYLIAELRSKYLGKQLMGTRPPASR